jgi:hypothetical protein
MDQELLAWCRRSDDDILRHLRTLGPAQLARLRQAAAGPLALTPRQRRVARLAGIDPEEQRLRLLRLLDRLGG